MGWGAETESKLKGKIPEEGHKMTISEIIDDRITTLEKICRTEVNRMALQTLELNRYIKSKLR